MSIIRKAAVVAYKLLRKTTTGGFLRLYGHNHGLDKKFYIENGGYYKELLQCLFFQKILRLNSHCPWPIHHSSVIVQPGNISFDKRYARNFMAANCYWQASSRIIFEGSFLVAQGVGFVSQNHDNYRLASHVDDGPIVIGDNCLIALNATVLPGIKLGENTIVAAGAVVTKSFPEGNCIIGGNPARVIKKLDGSKVEKCNAEDFWLS